MFTVAVVDTHADSRVRLSNALVRTLSEPGPDTHLIPRINVVPLAIQELKFHALPHVVIVGPGVIEQEITTIGAIRAQLPDAKILALMPSDRLRLGSVEHLIRLGADDVVDAKASGRELITRLVLLARRIERKAGGKLILIEGVKGGVGATSCTAALAELLAKDGKRVVMIDGDSVNRGLSRFVRARPIINENLQLILDGLRSSTTEFVAQTISEVMLGELELGCVAPPTSDAGWHNVDGLWTRNFMQAVEVIDETADFVLMDIANLTGSIRESLYRSADGVVLVTSQDPACLPAVVERVKAGNAILSPDVPVVIVRNERDRDGISAGVWQRELRRIEDIGQVKVFSESIPYVAAASRWPVSGSSMASLGSQKMRSAFEGMIAAVTNVAAPIAQRSALSTLMNSFNSTIRGTAGGQKSVATNTAIPLGMNARPAALLAQQTQKSERIAARPPELDFFVSAPEFSDSDDSDRNGQISEQEEMLVTPARISAA